MSRQVTFDYSKAGSFISEEEIGYMKKLTLDAKETLVSKTGAGNDFLGWIDLPVDYDKEEFARIKAAAKKIQSDSDVLLVIGIGGSYLGARAAIEFLSHSFYNVLDKSVRKTPEIYFCGNSISSTYLKHLMDVVGDRDFSINMISKSGTTTEPAIAFRVFKEKLEAKYGKKGAAERIYATTDKAKGSLKHLSDEEGYETFVVPDDVGGRFSVLTAVGLLPIAVSGADIDKLMEGAASGRKRALENDFDMGATHVILASSELNSKDARNMENEISDVDGVKLALGLDSVMGPTVPKDMIPDDIKEMLDNGKYQMIYVMSEYKTGSDEVNAQCDAIRDIIKKYDDTAMLIGEAPCTEDLITITNTDFNTVNAVSIILIFIIIAFVLKSVSLPVILVMVIEFAIFINMGIPHYTGTVLPFIASIVIGTIQLGATVDYAILMTNKYKRARNHGAEKRDAVRTALDSSLQSVIVSALSFFAATFGVGLYSSIDMISSLCMLLARGALISLIVVAFILPAMFMVFDKLICATSAGFRYKKDSSVQ